MPYIQKWKDASWHIPSVTSPNLKSMTFNPTGTSTLIVFSTPSFSEIYLQMCGVFEELDQEEEWSFLKWQSCILKFLHLELP
jgi:hypothetical protein